jgi:hypothetical protein
MKKKWKPKISDRYYYINICSDLPLGNSFFDVRHNWYGHDLFGEPEQALGIYRTKKEAEEACRKIKKFVRGL